MESLVQEVIEDLKREKSRLQFYYLASKYGFENDYAISDEEYKKLCIKQKILDNHYNRGD